MHSKSIRRFALALGVAAGAGVAARAFAAPQPEASLSQCWASRAAAADEPWRSLDDAAEISSTPLRRTAAQRELPPAEPSPRVELEVRPTPVPSEPAPVESTQPGEPFFADLHLRTLLRRDELSWNIAETGGVNVLSELSWDDVESRGVELAGSFALPKNLVLVGNASYGWIHDGQNQDSDYDGPDRTLEFSRSNNAADKGRVIEISAALGYELPPKGAWNWRFTPLVGLAYHQQSLHMRDAVQTIPDDGPFPGLDSRYRASWYGPWLGALVAFEPAQRWRANAGLQLHGVRYRAVADWNLREEFAHPESFEHEANGYGAVLHLQVAWQMTRRWTVDLTGRALGFRTRPGKDTIHWADGGRERSRLNGVSWRSQQLVLGATYQF